MNMMLEMLRSKIHRATVTRADLHYVGSITIDADLMDAAGLREYEKVHVFNISNGSRSETYTIRGAHGSGEIVMNGALARLAQVGDKVIIVSFGLVEESDLSGHQPKIIVCDESNRIIRSDG